MIRAMEINLEKVINIVDFSDFEIGHCYHVAGNVNFVGICTEITESYVLFTPFDIPFNTFDEYYKHNKYYLDKFNPRILEIQVDEIIIEYEHKPFTNETTITLSY